MQLSLFDLHCDTALRMLTYAKSLYDNPFAVSLAKSTCFTRYVQVMALFTPHEMSDADGWENVVHTWENLRADKSVINKAAQFKTDFSLPFDESVSLILGLEDARVLNHDLNRVDQLYEMGIRILTPLWKGISCIGGAHDTEIGLSSFGISALRRALTLGMIPDISHASERSAQEIFEISEQFSSPVIASHSNAYKVCPVSRNLRDEQIKKILNTDGLIGLNLYTHFLCEDGTATVVDVLRHIDYFLSLECAKNLCLGCDMDGATLPGELSDISLLPRLAEEMLKRNYEESMIHAIFFNNAYQFAKKYIH